jgi:hypothetical protein
MRCAGASNIAGSGVAGKSASAIATGTGVTTAGAWCAAIQTAQGAEDVVAA